MSAPEPHPGERPRRKYSFGDFTLDLERAALRRGSEEVTLRPKSFEVLTYLVECHGRLVTKAELADAVWAGTAVMDNSLARCLVEIRRALGDENQEFIRTVARRGYLFEAPVTMPLAEVPVQPHPEAAFHGRAQDRSPNRQLLARALVLTIVGALALILVWVVRPAKKALIHAQVPNPEAYAFYQRATYGPRLTRDSIGYFEKAIEKDPRFAPAHAGLASTYIELAFHAEVFPTEVMPKARQEALRALDIDDGVAEAHADLGIVKAVLDWDRPGAEREFRRALRLDSHLDRARAAYALFLAHMGRFDEAMDQIAPFEKGPVGLQSVYASILYFSRQSQRTIEYCKWALELAPNGEGLQYWLGRAYADQSRLTEAIELIERSRAADRQKGTGFGVLPGLYARAGRRSDALQFLANILELARTRYVSPANVAMAYIGLGDFENAFVWLDKACLEHDFSLSSLKVDPIYGPLRADPRFEALLHRLNLE